MGLRIFIAGLLATGIAGCGSDADNIQEQITAWRESQALAASELAGGSVPCSFAKRHTQETERQLGKLREAAADHVFDSEGKEALESLDRAGRDAIDSLTANQRKRCI